MAREHRWGWLRPLVWVMVLGLGLVSACSPPSGALSPRQKLTRALGDADVAGYFFETKEDGDQVVASLTNSAVKDFIELEGESASVTLKYTSVGQAAADAERLYKTVLEREGDAVSLVVTDVATGEVVRDEAFPEPQPHGPTGEETFESLEACLRDFDCTQRESFQCDANRTCQDQFVHLTCCLDDGQCFSVLLIIRPTTFRCTLPEHFTDFEAVVFAR